MPSANKKPYTLYDKVFQDHVVDEREDGTILLYIGIEVRFGRALKTLTPVMKQIGIWYTR